MRVSLKNEADRLTMCIDNDVAVCRWSAVFLRSEHDFPGAASEEVYEQDAASEARPSVEEILVYEAARPCRAHDQQT